MLAVVDERLPDVDKVVRDDVGETVEAIDIFEVVVDVVVFVDPVVLVVPVDVFYIPLFSVGCIIYILLCLSIAHYSTNTLGKNNLFVNINR